jgi:hypothetical protein
LLRHSNYDQKKKDTVVWPSFAAQLQLPLLVAPFQYRPEKKGTVVCLLLRYSNYNRKKNDTVVWPSFVAPFQLPLLRCSNYDWKKKIQSSVCCYAVPNLTGKKTKIWRVRDRYYDQKKKSSSRLSGGCMIVITTGKKKF